MCFHISQTKIGRELQERYEARLQLPDGDATALPYFYHAIGFTHPQILLIPQEEPSVITTAAWGLAPAKETPETLPSYYKKAAAFGGGLNAQSEKLFSHFLYKQTAHSQRCLIPVSGFFEPHEYLQKKFPYFITRNDRESFALAGLFTHVGTTLTCTILTKPAGERLAAIHNNKKRQPVLLNKVDEQSWLEDSLNETDILNLINKPYEEKTLDTFTVSRSVFHPQEDSNTPEALQEIVYPELQQLL